MKSIIVIECKEKGPSTKLPGEVPDSTRRTFITLKNLQSSTADAAVCLSVCQSVRPLHRAGPSRNQKSQMRLQLNLFSTPLISPPQMVQGETSEGAGGASSKPRTSSPSENLRSDVKSSVHKRNPSNLEEPEQFLVTHCSTRRQPVHTFCFQTSTEVTSRFRLQQHKPQTACKHTRASPPRAADSCLSLSL